MVNVANSAKKLTVVVFERSILLVSRSNLKENFLFLGAKLDYVTF